MSEASAARWADGCPCEEGGMSHLVSTTVAELIAAKGPLATVQALGFGIWLVPRVYIAAHGFKGSELPGLAEKYGWEKTA